MPEHVATGNPTIETRDTDPHLFAHNQVKIEITYPCSCGSPVRTSEILPRDAVVSDPDLFARTVIQVGQRARESWREHLQAGS